MTAKRHILVRRAVAADAAALCFCMVQIAKESSNLLYESSEAPSANTMKKLLGHDPYSTIFIAMDGDSLIGYVALKKGRFSRNNGVVELAMGVLQYCQSGGVGSSLMNESVKYCKQTGIHRIELRVSADNDNAIRLYKKFGFEVEGVARAAAIVSGALIDKIFMAKLMN